MSKETLKKIEQMEAELKALKESISKPEFEVGNWYKSTSKNTGFKWILKFSNMEGKKPKWSIAISQDRDYYTDHVFCDDMYYCEIIPATPEEIKSALIAEAEKRGFKKGVKCKNNGLSISSQNGSSIFESWFSYEEDSLWYKDSAGYNICVYDSGKWAEIIKDEVITICGKEVEFMDYEIKIGYIRYSTNDLRDIKRILLFSGIKSLNVGCNGQEKVDLNLINKILCRLEKQK